MKKGSEELIDKLKEKLDDTLEGNNSWDQLSEETDTQYKYFEHYLMLPPKSRSLLAAVNNYRIEQGKPSSTTIPGSWITCKSKFNWDERIEDYDKFVAIDLSNYIEQKQHLAMLQFRNRSMDLSQTFYETARFMIERATQALMESDDIRPSTASNMLRVSVDLARYASELGGVGLALDKVFEKTLTSTEYLSQIKDDYTEDELSELEESFLDGVDFD